jgi:hypothetical protein
MYIEVYAIGQLSSRAMTYIALTVEGNSWLWLNENINDDPFDTELDISSCHPHNPDCGNYVLGPNPDKGYYGGTNIGIYAVPPAVASAWLADGYISVNLVWSPLVNYLVYNYAYTTIPDYFDIQFSFPGAVIGDPHVFTLFGDSFELKNGIYTFFSDNQVTLNGRSTEPYHGYFITEFALLFAGETSWTLHGLVDQHYLPHLFFNDVEILPGSSLLNGRLVFS